MVLRARSASFWIARQTCCSRRRCPMSPCWKERRTDYLPAVLCSRTSCYSCRAWRRLNRICDRSLTTCMWAAIPTPWNASWGKQVPLPGSGRSPAMRVGGRDNSALRCFRARGRCCPQKAAYSIRIRQRSGRTVSLASRRREWFRAKRNISHSSGKAAHSWNSSNIPSIHGRHLSWCSRLWLVRSPSTCPANAWRPSGPNGASWSGRCWSSRWSRQAKAESPARPQMRRMYSTSCKVSPAILRAKRPMPNGIAWRPRFEKSGYSFHVWGRAGTLSKLSLRTDSPAKAVTSI